MPSRSAAVKLADSATSKSPLLFFASLLTSTVDRLQIHLTFVNSTAGDMLHPFEAVARLLLYGMRNIANRVLI